MQTASAYIGQLDTLFGIIKVLQHTDSSEVNTTKEGHCKQGYIYNNTTS